MDEARSRAYPRRTLLASGLGVAATIAGMPAVASASGRAGRAGDVASGTPTGQPGNRHVAVTRWSGPRFGEGDFQGTQVRAGGLRIARPTGTRAYTDPFGDTTTATYEQATWLSPTIGVSFGVQELIASWDVDTPEKTWIEVLVRGRDETRTLSGWYVLGRWCAKDPADGGTIHRTSVDGQKTAVATVYTDTFHAYSPHRLKDYQLQVNLLRPVGSTATPVIRALGAMASNLPDDDSAAVSPVGRAAGRVLDVPTLSQEEHRDEYPQWDNGGEAWCSPTSTAMVLRYWRTGPTPADTAWVHPKPEHRDPDVDFAARNVYDYQYDGAGNWPFNCAYAARYGLDAFVTRLRSFTEAEEFIRAGIPLVISVAFKDTELDGAKYSTDGHLMVVAGFTRSGDVVVNDPASHLLPDDDQVRTTYRRDQLERAWTNGSGRAVYVIRPSSVALPRPLVRSEPNW